MKTAYRIKEFIKFIKTSNIKSIKLRTKNINLLVNKTSYKNPKTSLITKQKNKRNRRKNHILTNSDKEVKINQIIEDKSNQQKSPGLYSTIVSPMVGTFYRSPAPNEHAFIEVGDTVKIKQIVCIVEAMKLMNEIESEVKGEVVEILVKDGDIVDCGQALVKVKMK
uniref:Biotin carboxyl carrier protein of acetyl-CoA carboxylase n=1 Tax=Tolypiocladia glomerulata TaxID=860646 RepID=A0A1Z1MUI1_9FLOR|nr:acetyl-CoA carboxylase biotin carboxyl carrier protein [Tolypiocladia glomerulata]ARW69770.1 acetyl-CoA carboxylase biotin carboxyl carrier protein [Tolypiocladia glomerulata]